MASVDDPPPAQTVAKDKFSQTTMATTPAPYVCATPKKGPGMPPPRLSAPKPIDQHRKITPIKADSHSKSTVEIIRKQAAVKTAPNGTKRKRPPTEHRSTPDGFRNAPSSTEPRSKAATAVSRTSDKLREVEDITTKRRKAEDVTRRRVQNTANRYDPIAKADAIVMASRRPMGSQVSQHPVTNPSLAKSTDRTGPQSEIASDISLSNQLCHTEAAVPSNTAKRMTRLVSDTPPSPNATQQMGLEAASRLSRAALDSKNGQESPTSDKMTAKHGGVCSDSDPRRISNHQSISKMSIDKAKSPANSARGHDSNAIHNDNIDLVFPGFNRINQPPVAHKSKTHVSQPAGLDNADPRRVCNPITVVDSTELSSTGPGHKEDAGGSRVMSASNRHAKLNSTNPAASMPVSQSPSDLATVPGTPSVMAKKPQYTPVPNDISTQKDEARPVATGKQSSAPTVQFGSMVEKAVKSGRNATQSRTAAVLPKIVGVKTTEPVGTLKQPRKYVAPLDDISINTIQPNGGPQRPRKADVQVSAAVSNGSGGAENSKQPQKEIAQFDSAALKALGRVEASKQLQKDILPSDVLVRKDTPLMGISAPLPHAKGPLPHSEITATQQHVVLTEAAWYGKLTALRNIVQNTASQPLKYNRIVWKAYQEEARVFARLPQPCLESLIQYLAVYSHELERHNPSPVPDMTKTVTQSSPSLELKQALGHTLRWAVVDVDLKKLRSARGSVPGVSPLSVLLPGYSPVSSTEREKAHSMSPRVNRVESGVDRRRSSSGGTIRRQRRVGTSDESQSTRALPAAIHHHPAKTPQDARVAGLTALIDAYAIAKKRSAALEAEKKKKAMLDVVDSDTNTVKMMAGFSRFDPRPRRIQEQSASWYNVKMKEIQARGNRKANFGKAARSLRARMRSQVVVEKDYMFSTEPVMEEPETPAQVFATAPMKGDSRTQGRVVDSIPDEVTRNKDWVKASAWINEVAGAGRHHHHHHHHHDKDQTVPGVEDDGIDQSPPQGPSRKRQRLL